MPIVTNKPSLSASLLCALVCAIPAFTTAAQPKRDIHAHGSSRLFWVAFSEKGTVGNVAEQFRILTRQIQSNDWLGMPPLPARVLALSSQGQDLSAEVLVLLETFKTADGPANQKAPDVVAERVWAWYSSPLFDKGEVRSEGRFSYGPVLPNRAKPLAVAGERASRTVWAIGRSAPPTTAPAASASTRALTTAPVATQLGLFSLDGVTWKSNPAAWPAEFTNDLDLVQMIVIGGTPQIALRSDEQIRVYAYHAGASEWRQSHAVEVTPAPRHFKLFPINDRPALWIQPHPPEGLGHVWTPDGKFPLAFSNSGALPNADSVDVTYAGDELRVVFKRDSKLFAKQYSRSGGETGPAAEIAWSPSTPQAPISWVTTIIMTVFTVLIISTLLRKRAAEREGEQRNRDDE